MTGHAAVSVLLPVHDALPHLEACRRSLERQSLRTFEVVAVDDGSTDGSRALLERWAREDPRIRLLTPGRIGVVEGRDWWAVAQFPHQSGDEVKTRMGLAPAGRVAFVVHGLLERRFSGTPPLFRRRTGRTSGSR